MPLLARPFAVLLLFLPSLFAQARLTLADAVSQALASHPQLASAAARLNVAEGLQKQAGLTLNPRFFVQSENTPLSANTARSYPQNADIYAFMAQTVETGGKRNARVEGPAVLVPGFRFPVTRSPPAP